jgi:hypothetical protein
MFCPLEQLSQQLESMSASLLAWFFSGTQLWVVIAVGVVTAALGIFCGRFLGKRGPASSTEVELPPPAKQEPIPAAGSGSERRVFPRYETRQAKLLISAGEHDLRPIEGTVLNRSLGGLCIWVASRWDVGTTLRVKNPELPRAAWVRLVVKNCRMQRGGWALGCQFQDGPAPHLFA